MSGRLFRLGMWWWWTYQPPGPASRSHQGILGIFGFLDGQEWGEGASRGHGDHGDCSDHGDRGSEHREVVTRPGALLEELGVARHQVGEEALSLLGEALAPRGRRGAVGAARLRLLAPAMTSAPPQPDLPHSALEELTSIMVQRGGRLNMLAAQRPGQVATLCRKETSSSGACLWLGWACYRWGERWGHRIPNHWDSMAEVSPGRLMKDPRSWAVGSSLTPKLN